MVSLPGSRTGERDAAGGTAVRGARGREEKAPRLVAALARGIGAVLGQVAVDAEPDEIPAVGELLDAFTDLAGAVITVGALHTRSGTAQEITGRPADCAAGWDARLSRGRGGSPGSRRGRRT